MLLLFPYNHYILTSSPYCECVCICNADLVARVDGATLGVNG